MDGVIFELHEGRDPRRSSVRTAPARRRCSTSSPASSIRRRPGSIRLQDNDDHAWSARHARRAGLGRSFQDARLFPSLTVAESIAVALERHLEFRDPLAAALGLPAVAEAERRSGVEVHELIELLGLGAFRNKFVSELSTGSRRIVDLAMTMAHDPSMLILDEPSSGIAQRETEALGPLLQRIQAEARVRACW